MTQMELYGGYQAQTILSPVQFMMPQVVLQGVLRFPAERYGGYIYISAISFGRKSLFPSNLVYIQRDPVPIDLSCSLIFTLSITEIQLSKVCASFPLDSRHLHGRNSMNIQAVLITRNASREGIIYLQTP